MGWVEMTSEMRPWRRLRFRVLSGWVERLRGLLGTGPDAEPVVLLRCGSIHTFGMTYPLDVAFVGERGEVLKVDRDLPPRRVSSCLGAWLVFERPASDEPWFEEGDILRLRAMGAEKAGEVASGMGGA